MKRHLWLIAPMFGIVQFLLAIAFGHAQMVPVLTRSYDNQRSGWNAQETVLTQANVATKGIVIKEVIPVFGDARGVEAQPLILPATKQGVRDVMVLCSMANQCRGVDAHTGADIWDVTLGTPILGGKYIDAWGINDHWGALSTGVIDAADNRFYQVFWVSPDGNAATARFYMAVLNVADGSQVVPPVMITGSSQGFDFNGALRKARSSAVLLNQHGTRTVLQCTGTVSESGNGADGFCFAFDTYLNRVTAMIATTAGEGAGIWMAGQGLSCDENYCYAITGNGDFDGVTQWGESFIQLQYTPPTAAKPTANLAIVKGWSPWTDRQRSGQDQVPAGKLSGMSMPSDAFHPVGGGMNMSLTGAIVVGASGTRGTPLALVYPSMATGQWSDEDFGSAGPACIFQIGVCVAAGKDGIAYPISVPGFTSTTVATVGTAANCDNLASLPVWLTYDGAGNPCPTDPATLNFFPNGYTAHLHATPVQFLNPLTNTYNIAAGGENQQVHIWNVSNAGALSYLGQGSEYASSDLRGKFPGGMTGSMCTGSSNGTDPSTYLLYCVQAYGNANTTVGPGHIIIYDPIHLANGVMKTLWDSGDWGAHNPGSPWSCMMDKFLPPIVDGGEIIESCYDGRVMVLGLNN